MGCERQRGRVYEVGDWRGDETGHSFRLLLKGREYNMWIEKTS